MGKRLSTLLTILLIFQPLLGNLGALAQESNQSDDFITNVTLFDEEENEVTIDELSGYGRLVFDWVYHANLNVVDKLEYLFPKDISVVDQKGEIVLEESTLATYETYELDSNYYLTISFSEEIEPELAGKGFLEVEVFKENDEADEEVGKLSLSSENSNEENIRSPFSATLTHHDSHYGFKMVISDVVDGDGNPYTEENPLGINDEFRVKIDWNLANNHNYEPGEHEVIQLPKEVYIPMLLEGELRGEASGDVIANYIVNTDGTVELIFTDFIKNYSNVQGWIEVFAKLDQDNVEEEDGKIKISPIDDEGELTIPIDRLQIGKTTEKQGEPNKDYNADEIEWTVTINKNAIFLENAVVTDFLPTGTEYVNGSLEIEKYPATINGQATGNPEPVTGITPDVNGQELSIPLGDINDVYIIKYKKKVTEEGMDETRFTNNVILTDNDLPETRANATVTIERGKPLNKHSSSYDRETGILTWTIDFNFDEKDLNNVTLKDEWSHGDKVNFVSGSLTLQEMEIDEHGNAIPVGSEGDESVVNGTLSVEEEKFEISGITTDKPYRITYELELKERELNGFTMNNTASFDEHESSKDQGVAQFVWGKGSR